MTTTETEGRADEDSRAEDETPNRSNSFVALFRLALPTAAVLLAVLYVESTFGRIRTSNLYYPYFVIGVMGLLTLTVYVEEIRRLTARTGDIGFVESVRTTVHEWRRSIGFTIIAIAYIWAIDVIGFFLATAIGMVSIMIVGGRRDVKITVTATVVLLVFIYGMFIHIMGLQPPEGPFGI